MNSLSKDLVFAVLQFLKEENFKDTVHMLEQETGIFFDLEYFGRLVMAGEFDRADSYLSGFTDFRGHKSSVAIFFEIRKQKYFEALDRKDLLAAVKILRNDLQVFKPSHPDVYVKLLDLLGVDDFRENEELKATSRDTKVQRTILFMKLKDLIKASPLFERKLTFPRVEKNRLRKLVNQSVNWQHRNCLTPRSNPNIKTLLEDHTCEPPNGARIPSPANNPLMGTTLNMVPFTPIPTTYNPFQPGVASAVDSLFRWPENLNHSATPAVASGSFAAGSSGAVVSIPTTDGFLKRPRTPPPTKVGTDDQFVEIEYMAKRFRSSQNDEARPNLCFNKEGSLLAVTTSHNGIKVLANTDGIQSLQTLENRKVPQESVVTKAPTVNLIDASNPAGHVPDAPENTESVPPQALITSVDSSGLMDSKKRIPEERANKSKNWKFAEVTDPAQCRSIKLPDPQSTGKIARLHYASFGGWLLALDTNARHTLWKWKRNDTNPSGKATTKFSPELCLPSDKIDMRNDTSDKGPGEAYPCIALTKNHSYASSCSGGKVSLFNLQTCQLMLNFGAPSPAATCLAFNPKDCNMMAIGMDDASIQILNCRTDEIKAKLKGHDKRITGLAFSDVLNALVSSGDDGRLCIWGTNRWEKQKSKSVQSQAGGSASSLADTEVQFHEDQVHLLVVQDSQIAIYDASKLECLCYWAPQDPMTAPISSATYSCDSLLVYASFCDGSVGVFDAEVLMPRCRIAPSAFMPGLSGGNTFPLVIAAHPLYPNQFAIRLTDGGVHVIEPAESEGKWGVGPSDIGSNKASELPPR